jgi:hypothetical protein
MDKNALWLIAAMVLFQPEPTRCKKTFFLSRRPAATKETLMRLILQLCLLVLMLLGAGNRAWGKVAVTPQTAVRGFAEDSDAPPGQLTSGGAAA